MATIDIHPSRLLVDEDWRLCIRDLNPTQQITLVCRVQVKGSRFFAHAHYVGNEHGIVDVNSMAAQAGGSYDGIEPMGLIWSQVQEPGQRAGKRLVGFDVTVPLTTHVYALDGFVGANDCLLLVNDGQWMAHRTCERTYMADGVQRISVKHGGLDGTLFIPNGPGPFPGVVDLFGAEFGRISEHRSALLASRGFASLTLLYFNFKPGASVGHLIVAAIEPFVEAVEYILNHPKVLKSHAGIIGTSKGAEIVLLTSCFCPKIKACVVISSNDAVSAVDHTYGDFIVPGISMDFERRIETPDGISLRELYKAPESERRPHQIPVERISGELLLIHGEDDQNTPVTSPQYMVKRLRDHGRTNYRLLVYPGTGHLIEPPHSPLFPRSYNPLIGQVMLWGGNPRQHARAQEAAWREILALFRRNLSGVGRL